MSAAPPTPSPVPLLVACLCAQWCRTCDAYRDTLLHVRDALQPTHPGSPMRFLWVDIEDFPTLLLARGDQVLFFGPLLPHAQTLDRLVRGALAGELKPPPAAALAPDVRALPACLRDHADL